MRLSISPQPARAAAMAAVAARVFLGLAVDMPAAQNGAWLSALIGGALALPWVYCVARCRPRRALLSALLMIWTLIDLSAVLGAVTRSAGYLALDRSPTLLLLVPAGLAAFWGVWRGGDAVGYAATVWARIAPVLLTVVALLQWRYYRPGWLTPILGAGWPAILEGGVRCAGWIAAASSVLLVADEPCSAAPSVTVGALLAAALIVLQRMLSPTRLEVGGWLTRLDALLCNGRTPLYLQLPMIALWFAALMHVLACEAFAAAALLGRLVPPVSGKLCGLLVVLAAMALSQARMPARLSDAASRWGFVAIGLATVAATLMDQRKGGSATCESGH